METPKASASPAALADQLSHHYLGVYESGPFKGRPIVHPFSTVLRRLHAMGVTEPERQFDETDRAYIERIDRTYTGIYADIIASGVLGVE